MEEKLDKIYYIFEKEEWHGSASESLWAKKLNDITYQLKNSPFYIKGLSYDDVVEAVPNEEGNLVFNKVIKRSNHSTYRIFLLGEISEKEFLKYWKPLEKIGCSYEKANEKLFSIDVPNETNIYEAYSLLEKGLQKKIWEFEEGHCGHPI